MSDSPSKQEPPPAPPEAARGSKSPPQKSPSPTVGSPKSASKSPNTPGSPSSPPTGNPLPGSHWTATPLAPEPDEEEDPTFEDNQSSTASLSSSILEYRTIQGRTYHSDRSSAEYWGTNDEGQNEALDISHHLHTLTLGGELYLAPIGDDIQTAVDIGTGTGIWAIDFGDKFPNCEVIGTDVSPIQPGWVPPNVKFIIDDCEQEWTFDPDSVDFIHMRYLTGSVKDWTRLLEQAFRCTKSGGYVQSFEARPYFSCDDGTLRDDSALAQWGKFFIEGGKKIGRTFSMVDDGTQKDSMEKAGFVDIEERFFKVPMGRWPKDPDMKKMGEFAHAAVNSDIEGYVLYMATLLGWTKEEVAVYAAHLRREMRDTSIHSYVGTKVVWGRKP